MWTCLNQSKPFKIFKRHNRLNGYNLWFGLRNQHFYCANIFRRFQCSYPCSSKNSYQHVIREVLDFKAADRSVLSPAVPAHSGLFSLSLSSRKKSSKVQKSSTYKFNSNPYLEPSQVKSLLGLLPDRPLKAILSSDAEPVLQQLLTQNIPAIDIKVLEEHQARVRDDDLDVDERDVKRARTDGAPLAIAM